MVFRPLKINRKKVTIEGIRFPDIESLDIAHEALFSLQIEGFEPTPRKVEIFRDLYVGSIDTSALLKIIQL